MNGPSSVCGVLGQIQGLRMPSRALSWKVFTLEYHHAGLDLEPPSLQHLYILDKFFCVNNAEVDQQLGPG